LALATAKLVRVAIQRSGRAGQTHLLEQRVRPLAPRDAGSISHASRNSLHVAVQKKVGSDRSAPA